MSTEVTTTATTNAIPEGKDLKMTLSPESLDHIGQTMPVRDYIIGDVLEDDKFRPFIGEVSAVVEQVGDNVIIWRISQISNSDLRSMLRTALHGLLDLPSNVAKVELIDAEAPKSTAASHFDTYKWWYLGGVTVVAAATIVIMRKKD